VFPFLRSKRKRFVSTFFNVGFHGDTYLSDLVDTITKEVNVFVETGTNVGSTIAYVARTYPHIRCLSCEPDIEAFQYAMKNTAGLSNVTIYNETSQEFLSRIKRQHAELFEQNTLFWIDAHGYGFKWPLKEEIAFITTNFKAANILIDDFKVPGLDCFAYDEYQGQECSFDYIKNSINLKLNYNIYYPNYTERTSKHHPLRGWGLIVFGHGHELKIPDSLRDKVLCMAMGNIREKNEDKD